MKLSDRSIKWGPRVKPLGYAQLSIGAKIHKSSSADTYLSIKTPFLYSLEGKKKGQGVINPSTLALPLH